MIVLLLAACDTPATAWPVDPCRLGTGFDAVSANVTCAAAGHTVEASFEWDGATRVGGGTSPGWEGLSFYGTGTTSGGGTLSVGNRQGGIGFYAREGDTDVVVGFVPAGDDSWSYPYVSVTDGDDTCDGNSGAGTVTLSGLPEDWVPGGVWTLDFEGEVIQSDPESAPATTSAWPSTCPISPASWASVRVSAACDGVERAAIQFLAPSTYSVELDTLGQVAAASATWGSAFSAVCAEDTLPTLDGSLQAADGALRLYTPVLTVTRDADGAWLLEDTACGECGTWVVTVEGLPDL